MSLGEALLIAVRGLRAHRLRSALTMLGLIIGVSAVILLVACGQGVQKSVDARIEPVANLSTIVPHPANISGGSAPKNLTDADASALQKAPHVATVTPATTGTAMVATSTTTFLSAAITGTTEIWVETNSRDLQAGSFFGDPAAAMGQTVQISHQPFRVIGVMQSYGQQLDNTAVMPLSSTRRYIVGHGIGVGTPLNQIIVQAPEQAAVPAAMNEVTRILNARHHITDRRLRDFQVQSLGRRLQTFNQIVRILTLFTPAVAAISLVVGGIGVLNIMLVSVTERTREIGIRKAIGATNRAILEQFLLESIVLAGLGGLVGVGVGLSFLVGAVAPAFDPSSGALAGFVPVLSVLPVVLSFAIGLVAGGYPAYRAARLLPIQALGYQ